MPAVNDAPGMGVAEIAEFCNVSKPNVRKMLVRHAVEPWFVLAIGPVYRRADVERMQRARMQDATARAADAQRKLSARRG